MRKYTYLLLLLALSAGILSACTAPATPAAPTAIPTAAVVPTTPSPSTGSAVGTGVAGGGGATCKVAALLPKIDPADANRFPAVSDQDWAKGPTDAKVTLLEYSDFM